MAASDSPRRERPLSPHLQVYRWQVQMVTSILHRATGIALTVGLIGLVAGILLNPSGLMTALGARQARYGANTGVMVLALLGILSLMNYLAVRNPQR